VENAKRCSPLFYRPVQGKKVLLMEQTKTSVFSNGLIWFGAAVSIAEILTGTLAAPLGFRKGLLAIIVGHIIGCILLYMAGLIGAKTGKSAMETVKISFGQKGSLLFSSLNVLQLVGWTAVMIASGATAANSIADIGGNLVWSIIIGVFIIIWVLVGFKNLDKLNFVAMVGLFILTIILTGVIFKGDSNTVGGGSISFGAVVELSVAMPLSWLPLISDYTRNAKKPKKATLVSAIVYFIVSCWMYIIGMGAAIFTGESDIGKIMMSAGLGVFALLIVIFSTVTTTYLDVYSAGVSAESISSKYKERPVAILVGVIGTLIAIFIPITWFEHFLYLISSIFAPMIAILIIDFFLLKKDSQSKVFDRTNLILWIVGFFIYRIFMVIYTPIGNTLPVMIIIALLCIIVNKTRRQENA
jgi:putative hydroxymethylpyrimidine transporter CytX